MSQYLEINQDGHNIRCKLYVNKIPDIKRVIIVGHGFAGHKDNGATQKFAERVLSKYKDTAVFIFNWPCHGDDVKKKLRLSDCDTYLAMVIDYVKNTYHTEDIFYYGTSFGGYMMLRYLHEVGNPFRKIVLRCPAIPMYEVLTEIVMSPEDMEKLVKGKPVTVGFDRKIDMNLQFLEDVKAADVRTYDYIDYADDILLIHGTKDEILPMQVVRDFSENNIIELIEVENADHRFQNPACMEAATKATLEFFGIA